MVRDVAAKAAEIAARIAGVLTVVRDADAVEIPLGEMVAATEIQQWYLEEALRLSGALRIDAKLARAKTLLLWMKQLPAGPITLRQILQNAPRPLRQKPRTGSCHCAIDGVEQ